MFSAQIVKAKAKLIKNKKLNTLRLIVAFNVYEKTEKGEYKFPVQAKCAYVSGDLQAEDVLSTLECAKHTVRAEIELV
jgi:hypothetical protein